MKKLSTLLSKKSFFVALVVDVLGILLSFLVNASLTNIMLARVGLFFYCIRFELIVILILLLLSYAIFYYISRQTVENKARLIIVMSLPIAIALVVSFIPLKKYVISRYYYFNNNYYVEESQQYFLENASKCIKERDWDKSIEYLNLAKNIYPNATNENKIDEAIETSMQFQTFCNELYNAYIKPKQQHIQRNSFECVKLLANLYPQKYERLYATYRDSISVAINKYPALYKSCLSDDYDSTRDLVLQYGWCWFEPIVNEKFSYDNKTFVMSKLKEYLQGEDDYSAQCRLVSTWISPDSINKYLK